MNKGHLFSFCVTTVMFLFIGCEVYTNISATADQSVDFYKYKSLAWLPDKTDTSNLPYNNEIIRNNIRNYVGQGFAERGYLVELDTPDVLLNLILTNIKKEKVYIYPTYSGPYYYSRYYFGSIYYFPYDFEYYYHDYPNYFYPPDYFPQKYEYIESSITLNVIDRKLNKLVWSGTAKGDVYEPDNVDDNIHPAVKAIMSKYPMKPNSKKNKRSNSKSDDVYK
jgi:hypothetical protein